MGNTVVGDGQVSSGAILNDGDIQTVQSQTFNAMTGGQAYDTTINSGGSQYLMYGSATGTLVNAGGTQYVYGTGLATGTVLNGGSQVVRGSYDRYGAEQTNPHFTYGTTVGTVINAGGLQEVRNYADYTVINNGGVQFIVQEGDAYFNPNSVDHTTVNAGGAQFIYSGSASNTHLNVGGSILLPQADYGATATFSFDNSTDVLHVTDGHVQYSMQLDGDYSQTNFTVSEDGSFSTFASLIRITAVPLCFCAGVHLATPSGEKLVEQVRVGDLVLTKDLQVRPIRWIGSTIALVSAANRPVLIRAGAFADDVPMRDVRVTRGHSFLFGNVLIPIGKLVNGKSIIWDMSVRTAEFFHIGLDRHELLLAEGAPAESYRNDGNLLGFTKSSGEQGAPGAMPTCAPVISHGPIVERTRRRLADRIVPAPAVDARTMAT